MIRCLICNQSYSRRDALQRHERNVHGSVEYTDQSQPLKKMTFRHPFSMMVTGPSGSGKTEWTRKLLLSSLVQPPPERILWCFGQWKPLYEPQLQPVTIDPTTEYRVEKILKRRVCNKRKEVLVRCLHWPKKYDSWIPEADVKDYN